MKTIDILRDIVKNHSAEVLCFEPPAVPVPEGLSTLPTIYELDENYARTTVEYQQYERPRLLVDMQTANAVVLVYDAATKDDTREKMDRLMLSKNGFIKVVEIAWKCVRPA